MTGARLTEIPVVFYRTTSGVEPVRDWLKSLPDDDRRKIGIDLATVQVGWPVGMPICRPIGVVHGFIKKTQRTPQDDLELARKRMKEMET